MRIGSPVTARPRVPLARVLLAGALLVSGCGTATPPVRPAAATTPPAAVASDPSAPSAPPAPSVAASAKPTGSGRASPAPTRRTAAAPPPLSLTLTEPMPPLQGRQITALYQDLCGDPSRGLVYVDVADPAGISTVWYEYHVRAPVPFDGVNRGLSVAGDFRSWRGGIGPFEADPRNAAGGTITLTAHGVYRDGSQRSVTATWTLRSCYR